MCPGNERTRKTLRPFGSVLSHAQITGPQKQPHRAGVTLELPTLRHQTRSWKVVGEAAPWRPPVFRQWNSPSAVLMGHSSHQGLPQPATGKEWWCAGHIAHSEGPLCPGAFEGRGSYSCGCLILSGQSLRSHGGPEHMLVTLGASGKSCPGVGPGSSTIFSSPPHPGAPS